MTVSLVGPGSIRVKVLFFFFVRDPKYFDLTYKEIMMLNIIALWPNIRLRFKNGDPRKIMFSVVVLLCLVLMNFMLVACEFADRNEDEDEDFQIDGDVYYVAPNGADSNPGTLERPFATINQA